MPSELFRFDTPTAVADWYAIDDRVMGGVFQSRLRYDPAGHAIFEEVVSLEHHGGFASVRSRPQALGRPRSSAMDSRSAVTASAISSACAPTRHSTG
ncbi:MAG: CIA30 family protein [Candidatus Competibacteraceae bacterium]